MGDSFLLEKSYIAGWEVSSEDVAVFKALAAAPKSDFVNALRWWNHINSYSSEFSKLGCAAAAAADDDEEDAAAEALKAKRVAEYNARKAAKEEKKGKAIAKSMITLDVKPWDDETDLDELAAKVKTIEMDGLVWGS